MKRALIIGLLLLSAALAIGQVNTVSAKNVRATEKLTLDTASVTRITRTVSNASTHLQLPTAKAVNDALIAVAWQYRAPSWISGNNYFSVPGWTYTDAASIRVLRNGIEYRVGLPGCSDCNVTFDTGTGRYTFVRPLLASELLQVLTRG